MTIFRNYDKITIIFMKGLSILILFISSLCFFSCKNSSDNKLAYTDVDTIKDIIKEKENNIAWTKEFEGTRLTDNIKTNKNVSSSIAFTPNVLKIFSDYQDPVYPELLDFGKLDTSKLDDKSKTIINDFADKLSKNIYFGGESYFTTSFIFNYVFFTDEFVNNYKLNFNTEFPYDKEKINQYSKLVNEKNTLVKEKESLENENNSTDAKIIDEDNKNITDFEIETKEIDSIILEEQKKEKLKKIEEIDKKISKIDKKLSKYNINKVFNKWIIGEPFYGEKILQIPLRFYCNEGTVDVTLYLNKENNKIYQITIDRWVKV